MRALVYNHEPVLVDDYPTPTAGEGEVLVAVRMAGICATDLEVVRGYMGFQGVMGHEYVGEVVEGPPTWVGRRVVGEINCVCGQCDLCRAGLSSHCRRRTVLGINGHDGTFAEYLAVPARTLYEVPESVSDLEAVFTEPLAAAYQIVRQIRFDSPDKVVVLGDGRLGQLVVRVLKPLLGDLLLIGKHAAKLEAAEKEGVRTTLVDDFIPRADADVVVDATASPAGFELAMQTVRPRGTIALKSTVAATSGMNLAPLVINELTVIGSRCGPFSDALRLLASREVDVAALVSARFPLRQGLAALEAAAADDKIKVVLDVR